MVPVSPVDALGSHAAAVRDLLVEVVRSRHNRSVEAHQASESRYAMGFGTQWRDLLDDTNEALKSRGFQSNKLAPGGYRIPVVNDCLVYVWRVPATVDAVSQFASSPTRRNGFIAASPPQTLFDLSFLDGGEPESDASADGGLGRAVMAVSDSMPVVLVMVQSSPRQLQSIEWGVAVLDDAGTVALHGRETLWEPEFLVDTEASDVESFDSGTPVAPVVKLQKQDRPSDA